MSRTHLYFALFYLLVGMTVMALSFFARDNVIFHVLLELLHTTIKDKAKACAAPT